MKYLNSLFLVLFLLSSCSEPREEVSFYDAAQTIVKESGAYRLGKRHGTWKEFAPNGHLICEKEYVKGSEVGLRKDYRNQQLILETPYQNNQIHGMSRQYDAEGRFLYTHQYSKGKLHGTSITYDYSFKDSIRSKKRYDNGLMVEERRYNEAGELIFTKSYAAEEQ